MAATVVGFGGLGLLVWRRPRPPFEDSEADTADDDQAAPDQDERSADAAHVDSEDEWLRELAGAGRPPHPG